ncbi:hypothetical protein ACFO3J_26715 [Streptomyces polygonati]|uniref:SUEL-type lectin domain-containing protein n=1 Tax=Streptomyces polygonati TaxID=1617087 RepID=A0ABV8HVV7_9ACTN
MFERVGDRILRAVLPQEKASACGWGPYVVVWTTATEVFYQRVNTCSGLKQCKIQIGDVTSPAACS